jgi:hypothetical protein
MAGSACSLARFRIVPSEKMKEVSGLQLRRAIGLSKFVNQKRKRNTGLITRLAGIDSVSQTNCCDCRTFFAKSLCVFAQLRGMLAAKDSSIVAQKNDDRRLFVPQRSEPDFPSITIRECDEGQLIAERTFHRVSIMSTAVRGVKQLPRAARGLDCLHQSSTSVAPHRSLIAHMRRSFVPVAGDFRLTWN